MSICFIYGNGKSEVVNECGNEHFEMDIKLKHIAIKKMKTKFVHTRNMVVKEQLFFLVYEKAMTSRAKQ
ncbi:hypothetical protein BCV71DRAFT_184336 [Rhizopus microsporus]|uniref:Uncharacterized protein n=1 Tax=Rhizopus microsporus TaxID=58291 RepID=A0A1X0RVE2_RHIZD|nr:hypothetical protein BCV71DRAFT_184336 [Rhizopus microsporus]